MMKGRRIAGIIALMVVAVLCFSACSAEENMLVGKWGYKGRYNEYIVFSSDKSVMMSLSNKTGSWELMPDGTLHIMGIQSYTITDKIASITYQILEFESGDYFVRLD